MAQTFNYDGGSLANVRRDSVTLTEKADHGEIGSGTVIVDDDAGTLEIVGHKSFTSRQSSCSDTRVWDGYVGSRTYRRGDRMTGGASREIELTLIDMNAQLGFPVILDNLPGAIKTRPIETVGERLTWLLDYYLAGKVADNGFVDYPSDELDEADYRGQFPSDVLRDLALKAGFNYFVYPDPTTGDASLWFKDSNTSTDYSSTLSISNVRADINLTTVFPPQQEAELERDPSEVYSNVYMPYQRGNVYRQRLATAAAFEPRTGVAPSADVKRRAKARALADAYLFRRRNEEDLVTATLRLPASKVNLVRAGQRIECKFSHFTPEGYGEDFSWFRVLEREVSHPLNDDNSYDVKLSLSPQESGGAAPALVQYKMVSHAVNTTITLDDPVTVGHMLVAVMVRNDTVIPSMQSGMGWSLMGSAIAFPGAGQVANNAQHGYCAIYAKVADSTWQTYSRETDSARIQWGLYEVSGAALDSFQVVSVDRQSVHATTTNLDLGTLTGSGAAFFAGTFPRESGEAGQIILSDFATGWTEDFDDYVDPSAFANPWAIIAHASGTAPDPSVDAEETNGGQAIGEAGGVAVLFT